MADLGEGKEQPLTTDGSGKFTLQPGQTAVFVGVGPGTPYNIREESLKGYIQTLPTVPEGYTGKKVMGDTVETWPFVNTPSEATGTLMVTKTVDSKNPDDNSKEFKFTVRLDDLTYSGTFPQTGGHEPIVFENGVAEFTLRHGQTVYIEGLPAGMNYQVVEEEANRNGYTTAISGDVGSIPADGTVTAAFLNQVTQYIVPHTGGPGVHAAWASLAAIAAGGALLLAVRAKARRKRGGRT